VEAPGLVAQAIDAVVRAARAGRSSVDLDAETIDGAGGQLINSR
jgi:hypothetical protein